MNKCKCVYFVCFCLFLLIRFTKRMLYSCIRCVPALANCIDNRMINNKLKTQQQQKQKQKLQIAPHKNWKLAWMRKLPNIMVSVCSSSESIPNQLIHYHILLNYSRCNINIIVVDCCVHTYLPSPIHSCTMNIMCVHTIPPNRILKCPLWLFDWNKCVCDECFDMRRTSAFLKRVHRIRSKNQVKKFDHHRANQAIKDMLLKQ